jgi:hypothetical protein
MFNTLGMARLATAERSGSTAAACTCTGGVAGV